MSETGEGTGGTPPVRAEGEPGAQDIDSSPQAWQAYADQLTELQHEFLLLLLTEEVLREELQRATECRSRLP